MSDTETRVAFPVVPIGAGVVFPGTVVTIALDSDDAAAGVSAARAGDGRVLLVPQIEGRSARVGVIAHVENAGELPGGGLAAIVRGTERAVLGAGIVGERSGLWVQADPVRDGRVTPRVEAMARELRVVLEEIAELRRSPPAAGDPAHRQRARRPGRRRHRLVGGVRGSQADHPRGDGGRRARRARAGVGP